MEFQQVVHPIETRNPKTDRKRKESDSTIEFFYRRGFEKGHRKPPMRMQSRSRFTPGDYFNSAFLPLRGM